MSNERMSKSQQETGKRLAALAEEAVRAFQEANGDAYKELVKAFEGRSADVGLLGQGGFHIAVQGGKLSIEPNAFRGGAAAAHGVASPATILDIAEGRLTPLEAYFKGDLLVRAKSPDLHLAYDYFVKFADAALRNQRLRGLIAQFREEFAAGAAG